MSPFVAAGAIAAGYLAGSIPTGYLVARARGVDIRAVGSGNIGATNVARTLGKTLGALVLVADAAKGFVPALLARFAWRHASGGPEVIASIAIAAILGHMFPVWLKFRGGKGVATGLGVFLALAPLPALLAAVTYAALYAAFRISSVGSLAAATVLLVTMLVGGFPLPFVILAANAWLLIVVKHRDNIRRLLRREERKV